MSEWYIAYFHSPCAVAVMCVSLLPTYLLSFLMPTYLSTYLPGEASFWRSLLVSEESLLASAINNLSVTTLYCGNVHKVGEISFPACLQS